jgi:hypothetical protein
LDGKRGMKRNAGHAEVFWDFGHPSSPQNPKRVRSVSRLLHLQRHPAMDWTAPDMSELFDSTESSLPRLHHPRSARLRLPLPLEERKPRAKPPLLSLPTETPSRRPPKHRNTSSSSSPCPTNMGHPFCHTPPPQKTSNFPDPPHPIPSPPPLLSAFQRFSISAFTPPRPHFMGHHLISSHQKSKIQNPKSTHHQPLIHSFSTRTLTSGLRPLKSPPLSAKFSCPAAPPAVS